MTRLLTAALAVPLLLVVILKAPAWAFFMLVLTALLIAFWELSSMLQAAGFRPTPIGYPSVAAVAASFYLAPLSFLEATLGALLLVGVTVVLRESPGAASLAGTMATAFATLYVGALGGSLIGLRMIGPEPAGRHWVVFLLTVVMVGDAGAFYAGRTLGRRRLAPRLSPKKTVEGLVGGALCSMAAACLLQMLWFPGLHPVAAAGFGLGLSLLGVAGDLFESFLKRSAGVKDSSSLIPGHGGVLDRIDSVLFSAPALLVCLRWLG